MSKLASSKEDSTTIWQEPQVASLDRKEDLDRLKKRLSLTPSTVKTEAFHKLDKELAIHFLTVNQRDPVVQAQESD